MPGSLWGFAIECYRRPGVAETCLRLQDDYAADINMLLAAAWLAARGACWNRADAIALMELCAEWRNHCVLPLRAARRHLKRQADAGELYARSKALELEAERHQLEMMEPALGAIDNAGVSSGEATLRNLAVYFQALPGADPIEPALVERLARLIEAHALPGNNLLGNK